MHIAFITRTQAKTKEDLDKSEDLKKLLKEVASVQGHYVKSYILANFENESYIADGSMSLSNKIIKAINPTSPVSINTVINRIRASAEKPKALLICSKEVCLKTENIQTLIQEMQNNPSLLVAGYKFKHDDDKLNNELIGYYSNKNLIAYRVPWNTCAIWDYELFIDYVQKFDEVALGKYPFGMISVNIDGAPVLTEHKGMEDGLAIAQATSQTKGIRFKLLSEPPLFWKVDQIDNHRKKLARKDYVMRNFMAIRNYSIEDLEAAEIKY